MSSIKKLVLIRHAHSLQAVNNAPDIQRELSATGIADTAHAAQWIISKKLVPDLILSSPAVRTLQTIRLICHHALFASENIQYDDRLYESSRRNYLKVIAETDNCVNTLFVVGHNFAISDLLIEITGASYSSMTPCSVASLVLDISSWAEIEAAVDVHFDIFNPANNHC